MKRIKQTNKGQAVTVRHKQFISAIISDAKDYMV
jgi:hypothetical protein